MAEVMAMETASRLGIDLSNVDWDSIHLPPGEDCGILSDDEDLNEGDPLEFDGGFSNIVVVDNIPIVPTEKFEKLEGVVRKISSQMGVIKEEGLWIPIDPASQKTLGYCFVEFNTPQEAELAKEKLHNYKLDRAHIWAVNMFDDIEKFMNVPDEWAPPETKPYVPGENLQHWLTDEKARDQFVIRSGSDTEVLWNDARHLKPDPVYKRQFWTESFVQWSPLGTYLATVHRQGAAVWGGASFSRLMRYSHPQVKLIDFSPGERFLVTYSSHEPSNPRDTHRVVLNIFDVRTGKVMRDFKGSADEFAVGGAVSGVSWPVFRWGGGKEDKYVATSVTSVHEMENGFNIWSFNGKLLYRILKDHFFQPTPMLVLALVELLCSDIDQ
ncbi:hypothetical protein RHSIM_Rhsim01G0145200 [Rhododendron simsii]|uniref:RRM domain-containing protein n=1 Tax=Rhododendron simsii TaxID=118357 RepID=A0A834HG76_RHOSS|nr:hypothetical protein RHSIM_Rhsim01G0145200 [Rhododendron simsii]